MRVYMLYTGARFKKTVLFFCVLKYFPNEGLSQPGFMVVFTKSIFLQARLKNNSFPHFEIRRLQFSLNNRYSLSTNQIVSQLYRELIVHFFLFISVTWKFSRKWRKDRQFPSCDRADRLWSTDLSVTELSEIPSVQKVSVFE